MTTTHRATPFGVDLLALARAWRQGWEEALTWPLFAWWSPQEPVRVLLPDGGEALWLGATGRPARAGARARAEAVVLPDSAVLVRELVLPRLTTAELREALALEVASASPFAADQTVWGWQAAPAGERLHVRLALAARRHVAAHLAREAARLAGPEAEVWADVASPIVLGGFAEGRRAARLATERRRQAVALVAAAALLLALAATPVLQARQRAAQAQAGYEALKAETAAVLGARNALTVANERMRALQKLLAEHPDVPQLIETLTRIVPDDAYLTRLEVHGREVRIAGLAANASQLMDVLGTAGGGFREVRAPAPISRAAGADKESFVIEFSLADEETPK